MSALPERRGGDLTHFGNTPAGARQLGSRVKPIIRLGMGIKREGQRADGSKYTRPDKTDYFTVRGDERAVAKFKSVYGEQPKAVKIMVPSSLSLALDISYRSFIGGGDDEGGRPLALGMTNFAPLGYVGGQDVLRVWKQDGSYMEVETAGLDEQGHPLDPAAESLNIEVYTTFTFTIPDVLGWGSFCQVTSKGRKSADNLSYKLTEVYSAFGSRAPWAFTREHAPQLVIKPDSAVTKMKKPDGSPGWGKVKIFVLDIVITEPFEDMQDRILERQRELGGAMGALYPSQATAALPPSSPAVPHGGPAEGASPGATIQQAAAAPSPSDDPPRNAAAAPGYDDEGIPWPEVDEPGRPSEPSADDAVEVAALAASMFRPESAKWPGLTLGEIWKHADQKSAQEWFHYVLVEGGARRKDFVEALLAFTRFEAPALYQEALAARAVGQS